MELSQYTHDLEQLIARYLAACRHPESNDVKMIAKQLTQYSQGKLFIAAALQLLLKAQRNKERETLLSSLVKDRFKYDFETIEEEALQSYYLQLCEVALRPGLDSKAAKNICLTVAYIYINLSAGQPLSLSTFLEPLMPKQPYRDDCMPYFTALQYIASEVDNNRLVVDEESRRRARSRAVEQQQPVLEMLNDQGRALLEMNIIETSMLECFACWVDLAYNPGILNSLPGHSLMQALFRQLLSTDDELSYSAANCIKVIISAIRNQSENGPIVAYLGTNLVPLVAQIDPHFARTPQAELYAHLILAFSAKSLRTLATPSQDAMQFLRHLVHLTRLLALDIFAEMAGFWAQLLEEVLRLKGSNQGFGTGEMESLLVELFQALIERTTYPSHVMKMLQTKSERDVTGSCHDAEVVYSCRGHANHWKLFELISSYLSLEEFLHHACDRTRSLADEAQGMNFWCTLEAILASLYSPLRKVPNVNEDVALLANTYGEISNCDKTPIFVKITFMKLFRQLMNVQQKEEMFIKRLFYYATDAFTDKFLLIEQAEKTFCRGCELNGLLMVPNLSDFLAFMSNHLHREQIVRGVFAIITSHPHAVNRFLLQALQMMLKGVDDRSATPYVHAQRMLAMVEVCKQLKVNRIVHNRIQIMVQFVRSSMPFICRELSSGITKEDENSDVERAVKMLKHLMRCLKMEFWPFVSELYEAVMESFREKPICSYVYLVEVAITVFAKEPACQQYLLDLYGEFCAQSYQYLGGPNWERLNLLLQDFLGMNKRFFTFNVSLVLKGGQLPQLIDHCIDFLSSDSPSISKATYSFFETVFMAYWPAHFIEEYNRNEGNEPISFQPEDLPLYEQLKDELQDKVHYILAKMLQRLSQTPPDHIRSCIMDSVFAELKAFPEWNLAIWQQLITPLPNNILLIREKEEFLGLLAQTQQPLPQTVTKAQQALQKLIWLIDKRMATAAKRRNYEQDTQA